MIRANRSIRLVRVVAATAVASLALAGCSQIPSSDNTTACEPTTAFAVERSGGGSGPVVTDDGVAVLTVTLVDAAGEVIVENEPVSPGQDGKPSPIRVAALQPGIIDLTRCATTGETVSAAVTNTQLFGEEYVAQTGLPADDEQHLTVTVNKVYHSAASGRIAPQLSGIPAVVNSPGGGVGVTMPKEAAPTELRKALTIEGFGAPIADGDLVVTHLSTFTWSDGTAHYSSWDEPGAVPYVAATALDNFYGAAAQLVGVPIGSQVVVVVPATQIQQQPGPFGPMFGNGDAVVFVFDVLGTL